MKGDRIRAIVDIGGGATAEFVTEATKNGRRVEIRDVGKWVHVCEVKGGAGETVRTNRFLLSGLRALIEETQEEPEREQQMMIGDVGA